MQLQHLHGQRRNTSSQVWQLTQAHTSARVRTCDRLHELECATPAMKTTVKTHRVAPIVATRTQRLLHCLSPKPAPDNHCLHSATPSRVHCSPPNPLPKVPRRSNHANRANVPAVAAAQTRDVSRTRAAEWQVATTAQDNHQHMQRCAVRATQSAARSSLFVDEKLKY
jgi:hypothetical protein